MRKPDFHHHFAVFVISLLANIGRQQILNKFNPDRHYILFSFLKIDPRLIQAWSTVIFPQGYLLQDVPNIFVVPPFLTSKVTKKLKILCAKPALFISTAVSTSIFPLKINRSFFFLSEKNTWITWKWRYLSKNFSQKKISASQNLFLRFRQVKVSPSFFQNLSNKRAKIFQNQIDLFFTRTISRTWKNSSAENSSIGGENKICKILNLSRQIFNSKKCVHLKILASKTSTSNHKYSPADISKNFNKSFR